MTPTWHRCPAERRRGGGPVVFRHFVALLDNVIITPLLVFISGIKA